MSKGGGLRREVVRDGVDEGAVEVSEGELLLEDLCWVFEEESRRKAVSGVSEHEVGKVGEVDSLVEEGCVEVEALFYRRDGVLD